MLSWLRRRRDEAQRADADAAALIAEGRPRAYSEARRREREAADAENAQHCGVARAIARRQADRARYVNEMPTDPDLTPEGHPGVASRPPLLDIDPLDELQRLSPRDPIMRRNPAGSGDAQQKIQKNRASDLGAPDEAADFSPPPGVGAKEARQNLTRGELCAYAAHIYVGRER